MTEILQLKITLQHTNPPIWRRILVDKTTTFFKLHHIIQTVMGWKISHLYEFEILNYRIGEIDNKFKGMGYGSDQLADACLVKLEDAISKSKDKFSYMYDFGDAWKHNILVEKILPRDTKIKYPICITGKLCCPPEDCGGVWGYYQLLDIVKDKNNSEHKNMLEWLGEDFNEKAFNKDEVNEIIQNY